MLESLRILVLMLMAFLAGYVIRGAAQEGHALPGQKAAAAAEPRHDHTDGDLHGLKYLFDQVQPASGGDDARGQHAAPAVDGQPVVVQS